MIMPNIKIKSEKQRFSLYKEEIQSANLTSMFRISILGTAICAVLTFLSLPFIGVLKLTASYFTLMMIFLLFCVLSKMTLSRHPGLVLPVYYILMAGLDILAIYMGTVKGINTNATTILVFLLLLPLFIIDYPWRLALLNICVSGIFMWADCQIKNPGEILSLDLSNAVAVCCISIAFIEIVIRRQINSFDLQRREMDELEQKNNLINTLPVGVAVFEVRGTETTQIFTNDEFYRLFEDNREARTARINGNFMNSIHPDDRVKLGAAIKSVIDGAEYVTQPCRSIKGDGNYIWVRFSSSVAKRTEDYLLVYSTYSSMEDEMKSRQATQAKTDFLSRVSHDMRTPLNGILGLTALMQEYTENPQAAQDLQQLQMSGEYLLNLINDTLDVSRIESGKLELNPVVCDGKNVFNNVIALAKPNLSAKHIKLNVETDNLQYHTLFIDIGRVEQIIMNILGNAVKFSEDGGAIDFKMETISVENGIVTDRLTIRDRGIGMSEEFLPRLFEPFSQENQGRTNSYQGTGLGMSITKRIIELMGGEINVASEIGLGTTFTIVLPMRIATEMQVNEWKKGSNAAINDERLKGRRVLLCEDHPLNAAIATRLLEKKGLIVEHAENGLAGLNMFENSAPGYYDAVLMDIRMPIMDGLEATRKIRSLSRPDAALVPIIAMTANAFDEDVRQSQDAGMNAHLGKPIETHKLFATLEQMIGN